jgi:hypothetical protein
MTGEVGCQDIPLYLTKEVANLTCPPYLAEEGASLAALSSWQRVASAASPLYLAEEVASRPALCTWQRKWPVGQPSLSSRESGQFSQSCIPVRRSGHPASTLYLAEDADSLAALLTWRK